MGNVHKLVTKSGTNSFHGSIAAYLQHNDLVDPNITLDESELGTTACGSGASTIDDYYDLGQRRRADHSDRLWFFGALQFDESTRGS
jgi:hypothetical protein